MSLHARHALAALTAAALISAAACSTSAGADAPTELSGLATYVPTAGPGDPTLADPSAGASSMTAQPGPASALSGAGAPSGGLSGGAGAQTGAASTGAASGAGTGGTGPMVNGASGTGTAAGTTVWPAEPTVSLAPSLVVSIGASTDTGPRGRAVVASYTEAVRFMDEAYASPTDTWAKKSEHFMAGAYRDAFIAGLDGLSQAGLHGVGHLTVTGVVGDVGVTEATIHACIDTSHHDIVDATGHSMVPAKSSTFEPRYRSEVVMTLNDGYWKLTGSTDHRDQQC